MDWETLAKTLAALVPAVVALVGLTRGPGSLRARLKHDAEILEKLPPSSSAHKRLLGLLDTQIERVAKLETDASRHWPSFVGALLTAPALGYATVWLFQRGTWWGVAAAIPVGLLTTVLIYGVFESAQRVPRDKAGKRI